MTWWDGQPPERRVADVIWAVIFLALIVGIVIYAPSS